MRLLKYTKKVKEPHKCTFNRAQIYKITLNVLVS